MARAALQIVLTDDERETLTAWSRASSGEHRLVERCRVILLAAEGFSAREIARRLKTRLARVSKWRQRFGQHRLAGLDDAPRTGKPRLGARLIESQPSGGPPDILRSMRLDPVAVRLSRLDPVAVRLSRLLVSSHRIDLDEQIVSFSENLRILGIPCNKFRGLNRFLGLFL